MLQPSVVYQFKQGGEMKEEPRIFLGERIFRSTIEARLIPVEQTVLPAIIKENKEKIALQKLSAKEQKVFQSAGKKVLAYN